MPVESTETYQAILRIAILFFFIVLIGRFELVRVLRDMLEGD